MRHVRDRQRHDFGALPGARQPAALDPRQMLADGVDLADRRTRAQQRPSQLLLLRERYARDRRDPLSRACPSTARGKTPRRTNVVGWVHQFEAFRITVEFPTRDGRGDPVLRSTCTGLAIGQERERLSLFSAID